MAVQTEIVGFVSRSFGMFGTTLPIFLLSIPVISLLQTAATYGKNLQTKSQCKGSPIHNQHSSSPLPVLNGYVWSFHVWGLSLTFAWCFGPSLYINAAPAVLVPSQIGIVRDDPSEMNGWIQPQIVKGWRQHSHPVITTASPFRFTKLENTKAILLAIVHQKPCSRMLWFSKGISEIKVSLLMLQTTWNMPKDH